MNDSYFSRCTINQKIRLCIATALFSPFRIILVCFCYIGEGAESLNNFIDTLGKRFIKWNI